MRSDNGILVAELQTKIDSNFDASTFPVEALQSNLIIKPAAPDDKSEGGIIIPDSVKERPSKGEVVSIGEDLKDKPIKVGMFVWHVKSAGTKFEHNKQEYYIMRYTDCLAVYK